MGQSTGQDKKPGSEPIPATPQESVATPAPKADAPTADAPTVVGSPVIDDDSTPYVPRVFAFDPKVKAIVYDPEADPQAPTATSTPAVKPADGPVTAAPVTESAVPVTAPAVAPVGDAAKAAASRAPAADSALKATEPAAPTTASASATSADSGGTTPAKSEITHPATPAGIALPPAAMAPAVAAALRPGTGSVSVAPVVSAEPAAPAPSAGPVPPTASAPSAGAFPVPNGSASHDIPDDETVISTRNQGPAAEDFDETVISANRTVEEDPDETVLTPRRPFSFGGNGQATGAPDDDADDTVYSPRREAPVAPVRTSVTGSAAAGVGAGAATAPWVRPAVPVPVSAPTTPAAGEATALMPPAAADVTAVMPAADAAAVSGAPGVAAATASTSSPAPTTPPALLPAQGPVRTAGEADAGALSAVGTEKTAGAPKPAVKKRRGSRTALLIAAAVVLLGVLYTGAQWFFADKVPSGTTVAGVEVGGESRQGAQAKLTSTLGTEAKKPIQLSAGDGKTTLDPKTAGLTFDAAATADSLTSFSMNPVRLWEQLTGGGDIKPVIKVDEKKLATAIAGLGDALEKDPVDGTVQFVKGVPTATEAKDGTALVTDEAAAVIRSGWLVEKKSLTLPTKPKAPAITQAKTDAALAVAKTVVKAPVVVKVGEQQAELPPETLAGAASFAAKDGELTLVFDGVKLSTAVVERTNNLLKTPDDAHFVFEGGKPKIVGGEPGTRIDPAELSASVAKAAVGDTRTASAKIIASDPAESIEKLQKLGIKERVSEFSTPLTNEPIRTKNLVVGAQKLNGTLIQPGEVFSLTEALSPITREGGYYAAGIVQDGKHVQGVGGGLSQMATTTYNAGFFAGLEDVEHRQHSYWFTRYPAGREATIFVGSLDMRFKNDTPYGLLMQSWVAGGRLHVAIWSTKYYTVETSASGKSGIVQPTTVTHTGADCVPQGAGNPGFSITNYRKVYVDGKLVKDERYPWTYKPDNRVVCEP